MNDTTHVRFWDVRRNKSSRRWTDSGEAFDDRGLKHRAENDTRSVPIPPELVMILREHIEEFGTAADGRLFRTATGGMIFDHLYLGSCPDAGPGPGPGCLAVGSQAV